MKILRQGISFVVIGLAQLAIDWLVFVVLTKLGCSSSVANVSGRIVGASFGFWFNGVWTFSGERELRLHGGHFMKFLVLWFTTTVISTIVVVSASRYEGLHVAWIVKPVADLLLAFLSFLVSKYWVYK